MPNLIQQTPFPRTTPQLPYSRWASLVDANVATWSPTWIVQRNSYRPAPLGRIARATHSRIGDAIGPEVMSEPIPPYSRWQSIIDADIEQRVIAPLYAPDYRSTQRRRIDKLRAFGDLYPGPSVIDQPSGVPWQKYEVDNAVVFDPAAVVTPTYYVADFMAREANKIDVRQVNQPDTDWVWDRTDDVIAQTIIPPTYNLKYRATDPVRIDTRTISEPSFAWDSNIVVVAGFDETLWPAIQLRPERSPEGPKLKVIDEPSAAWIWDRTDDVVAQTMVPLFELQPKYISPERRKTFVSFVNEPDNSPWIWRVSDDVIATIAPNLWVPKYLARDRQGIDIREISEPEFGWIIVPNVPPYVPLDPKLWPAIEQQLNAIRTRSRNELNVITINVPGFGWVTGYIPAVVIATGSHKKRKWRRSG